MRGRIADLGANILGAANELGGLTILVGQVLQRLVPPRLDRYELFRNLHWMGNRSLPIIAITAFFVGGIMVLQAGLFVLKFNATGLVGWGTGYVVFRELGPVLIALMFSGRVGSNNTAELGTMTVTEQLDGLRALAIDPIEYLVVPRVLAMTISLVCLTILGNVVAVVGGGLVAQLLLGIDFAVFRHSLIDNLGALDFVHGVIKAGMFGVAIAITSCHFGVTVRGGAIGVGRAVNNAVVVSAVSILCIDFFITFLLP